MEKIKVKEIAVKEIRLSGINPRKHFDEQKMVELMDSIKEKGIIEPLIVREVKGEYELVCGERRFRASLRAGIKTAPAVIRELTDVEAMEFRVIENLQREDLDPIEEARGYQVMLEKCGYTQTDLAGKVGKKQGYIANRLRLLGLNKNIQESISREIITQGHAMVILRLKDTKARAELFKQVVERKLSVRAAENDLHRFGRELKNVPFDRTECKACLFKGDNLEDLADKDTKLKGTCLSPDCFMKKARAGIKKKADALRKKGFQVTTEEKLKKRNIFYGCRGVKNIGKSTWAREALGPKYKKKCQADCPGDHYYVIRTRDWGCEDQIGLQYIEEWCTKPTCFNELTCRNPESSGESAEGRKERQNQGKVRETKRRIWIKEVSARVNAKAAGAMVLRHLMNDGSMFFMEDDNLWALLKRVGIFKKGDDDIERSWDSDELQAELIGRLYDADEKKVWEEIRRQITERDVDRYDDEVLDVLSRKLGFNIRTDFVIDEEYLKTRTKEQLVAIAEEIGLVKYLAQGEAMICQALIDKPGNMIQRKKSELIDLFLKKDIGSRFELKGKVPKEIKKQHEED